MENKCPLCGKINPDTEWVCESCGAELPMKGQRTPSGAPPAPPAPGQAPLQSPLPQGAPPSPRQGAPSQSGREPGVGSCTVPSCGWSCLIAFLVFFFLPLSCTMIRTGLGPAPTPVPTLAPIVVASPTPAPTVSNDPCASGATAICADGSKSFAANHSGACSHHGGVASWCR